MATVKRIQSKLEVWTPKNGSLIYDVLRNNGFYESNSLNDDGYKIIDETHKILEVAVNPLSDPESNIGLVLGYVQSGKTLSFTSLIGLAIDNGFKLIVVFSGTKLTLNDQTFGRMCEDLNAKSNKDKFIIRQDFENQDSFKNIYRKWSDPDIEESQRRSLIVIIKKNKSSIEKLIKSFGKLELSKTPSIIIDDEADQASLDTKESKKFKEGIESGTGEFSTTHKYINLLRDRLRFNSYIQYTATPQALTLLNNNNLLSPDFLKIISPGSNYTGGKTYFLKKKNDLIKEISFKEIQIRKEKQLKCPESLYDAMRHFYVAATINELEIDLENLTMMVHPAVTQNEHFKFTGYVKGFKNILYKILKGPNNSIRKTRINEFKNVFENYKKTYKTQLQFDEVFLKKLSAVINYTSITELNTREGKSKSIDYEAVKNHIVVGGGILDRGLTLEGLIVSHMFRNPSKQVDTNMQRARFFGYKRKYIDLCRVWMDRQTIEFYTNAIKDEEANRSMLKPLAQNNKKLDSSRMRLILNKLQRPTRSNVIYDPLKRSVYSKEWVILDKPHNSNISENLSQFTKFYMLFSHKFSDQNKYSYKGETQHLYSNLPANDIVDFLTKLEYYDNQNELDGILNLIDEIKDPNFLIQLVLMSSEMANDKIIQNSRKRTITKKGIINQYFQGRTPKDETLPERYPGDRAVKDKQHITIQVHQFLINDKICFGLAFSVPQKYSYDTIRHN